MVYLFYCGTFKSQKNLSDNTKRSAKKKFTNRKESWQTLEFLNPPPTPHPQTNVLVHGMSFVSNNFVFDSVVKI